MDVDEGLVREDFTGRTWEVKVQSSADARRALADAKDEAMEARRSAGS